MGETTYQRIYRIGSAVKRIIDAHPGASQITNHHDRKAGGEDFIDAVSGTHGLAGAADTVIVVARKRHDPAAVAFRHRSRCHRGRVRALCFENDARWCLDGKNLADSAAKAVQRRASAGLGDRSVEILAYVGDHPRGVSASDVAESLGIDDAGRYLARLVDAGKLQRITQVSMPHLPPPNPLVLSVFLSQRGLSSGQKDT